MRRVLLRMITAPIALCIALAPMPTLAAQFAPDRPASISNVITVKEYKHKKPNKNYKPGKHKPGGGHGHKPGWNGNKPGWNGNKPGWNGNKHHHKPGHWNGHAGYRYYRPGYRQYNDGWWYPLAAFGVGAVVGGAIASQPSSGGNAHIQWCYDQYRSYRASDNTYQPYEGPRQQCYSPYS